MHTWPFLTRGPAASLKNSKKELESTWGDGPRKNWAKQQERRGTNFFSFASCHHVLVLDTRQLPVRYDSISSYSSSQPWGVAKQAAVGQIPSPIDSSQARKHPERERHRCRNLAWQSTLPARRPRKGGCWERMGWDGRGGEDDWPDRTSHVWIWTTRARGAGRVAIRFSTRRASKSTHAR